MRFAAAGILCLIASLPFVSYAQRSADSTEISSRLASKYISSIGSRSGTVSTKIDQNTRKYLEGLKNQEQSLQKQLSKIDSNAAARIFRGSAEKYNQLENDLSHNSANVLNSYGRYVPGIDTAITSLKFLQQGALVNPKLAGQAEQIKSAMGKVHELEDQFKKADNVQDFIRQRKEYLQQQLSSYNLGNGLAQYGRSAYYYSQQITDLKQAWQDPSRMEQKAMEVLNKLPAFRDFMKKNNFLAGIFNIPDTYSTSGLAGLQTRDQVQQIMQQQMTILGPNGSQTAQQNIGNAQSSLTSLRNRVMKTGSTAEMPDFKPNDQRTKSFLKRLEYGINVQNNKSTYLIPISTDFAATIGYRINNRSSAGIGMSYRVGWGEPVRHIRISNLGIGFRSYLDVQIRGSFYASGGFEENYENAFRSLNQITAEHLWQPSGLIGISKIISLKGKLMKKTKVQLFWDALSYAVSPQTQHFKLRIGYGF